MTDLKSYTMPYDGTLAIKVEVFHQDDCEPFICGVFGKATTSMLEEIEAELLHEENEPEIMFPKGAGIYLMSCNYFPGQYGEFGMCEIAPGWECGPVGYRPFPA